MENSIIEDSKHKSSSKEIENYFIIKKFEK